MVEQDVDVRQVNLGDVEGCEADRPTDKYREWGTATPPKRVRDEVGAELVGIMKTWLVLRSMQGQVAIGCHRRQQRVMARRVKTSHR